MIQTRTNGPEKKTEGPLSLCDCPDSNPISAGYLLVPVEMPNKLQDRLLNLTVDPFQSPLTSCSSLWTWEKRVLLTRNNWDGKKKRYTETVLVHCGHDSTHYELVNTDNKKSNQSQHLLFAERTPSIIQMKHTI